MTPGLASAGPCHRATSGLTLWCQPEKQSWSLRSIAQHAAAWRAYFLAAEKTEHPRLRMVVPHDVLTSTLEMF